MARSRPLAKLLSPPEPSALLPKRFWVLLACLPLAISFFRPGLAPLFNDSFHPDFLVNRTAASLLDATPEDAVRLVGAWAPHRDGLRPAPDAAEPAALEIHIPDGAWDRAVIEVIGAPDSVWAARFVRRMIDPERGDEVIVSTLASQNIVSEKPFTVPAGGVPASDRSVAPMTLRLEPRDPGRAAEGDRFALLRRVDLRVTSDLYNRLPIGLPDVLALGLLPMLVALMLRTVFGLASKRCLSGGLGFGLLFGVLLAKAPAHTGFVWSIATGLSVALAAHAVPAARGMTRAKVVELQIPREQWNALAAGLLLVFVLLVGLGQRWEAFETARRQPLGWDATGFVEIALSGRGLYETGQSFPPWVREPILPWLLRGWFQFAPVTESSARVLALGVSLVALAAVFLVGRRLFGWFPALVAALVLAWSPHWAANAVRVLRLDLLVLVLMGLLAVRLWWDETPYRRAVGIGLLGAVGMLTRLSTGVLALPVLAWEAWRRRWGAGEILLALALALVPVLPHLAFNRRASPDGDLFYSSSVHTRYYLNQEFAGQPGHPTVTEVAADPYAGEPVGVLAYFFRYHGVGEVLVGHVVGMWDRFVWGSPRVFLFHGHEWLMLPGLLGAWVLWRDRKAWVLGWFVLAVLPYAFIASRGAVWRLGGEAHVVVLWIWALGVQQAALWGWGWLQERRARRTAG
jgi:hypothetical protein